MWLAGLAIAGVVLGEALPWRWGYLAAGGVAAAMAAGMWARGRVRGVRAWGAVAAVALSAGWAAVRTAAVPGDHISHWVTDEPQLVQVVGVVDGPPWLRKAQRGPFAGFDWQSPATLFVLDLRSIAAGGVERSASGRLIVRIDQAEPRLRPGQRIRVEGWLGAIRGPQNPGEFDFRQSMRNRGIEARLTLPRRGNWALLAEADADPLRGVQRLREAAAGAAMRSLRLGLEERPRELGLLQTLLLGRWSSELAELEDEFRAVGLTHILSISGAHLAILMMIVWLVARLAIPHPPRAAMVVLAVLLLYLMAVPLRVPIVRAGLMAGLFCIASATGRRTSAMGLLGLACVACLAWRPMDLFTAGFQLSFGIVAAMLQWTRPVAAWLWPPPVVRVRAPSLGELILRRLVDYVAASLVAFAVAAPVVAYHFQVISPLAVLLSVLSLPVVTGVLAVGYLKVLVGLAVPSGGIVLAGPLAWLADAMLGLVEHSATWPAASVELAQPPTLAWTLGAVAVVAALLAGAFRGRRRSLACAGIVVAAWLVGGQWPGDAPRPWEPRGRRVAVDLAMLAVGDGSCFVLRLHPDGWGEPYTLVFDCGSAEYLDVGSRTVVPTLRRLGVERVDLLVISHADLDHYSGVPDVLDALPVERVLLPPQLAAEARAHPESATGFLLERMEERGVAIEAATRGWTRRVHGAHLQALWPPPGYTAEAANDTSLVLRVGVAGRVILLHGDAQEAALGELLRRGDALDADATDLPHHGSFVECSPRWLAAVSPAIALQSSGHARLRDDKWAALIRAHKVDRYVTAYDGMVRVRIARDGSMTTETFLE